MLAALTLATAIGIAQKVLALTGLRQFARWAIAVPGASLMALAGYGYDALRLRIHDHGSEPIRSLWLLVPLGLGFTLALLLRHSARSRVAATLERGALVTVLLSFALLVPNGLLLRCNARGAARSDHCADCGIRDARARVADTGATSRRRGLVLTLVMLVASLYGLRDVGGRTREMAYFVFLPRSSTTTEDSPRVP